jgi:Zn-dependent peptidase ImmA (M78 family)
MNFEDFLESFTDTTWFEVSDRPKTFAALRTASERIPEDVLENLSLFFFAPGRINGQVYPCFRLNEPMIFLALHIEELSQEEVDYIVAHEIAHVHLGHDAYESNTLDKNIEDETDALTREWGFTIPARRSEGQ